MKIIGSIPAEYRSSLPELPENERMPDTLRAAIVTDVDSTIFNWDCDVYNNPLPGYGKNYQAFARHQNRAMLNKLTGRSKVESAKLHSHLSEQHRAPFLLGTDDGKQGFYYNDGSIKPEVWFQNPGNVLAGWDRHIEEAFSFNHAATLEAIKEVYRDLGFREISAEDEKDNPFHINYELTDSSKLPFDFNDEHLPLRAGMVNGGVLFYLPHWLNTADKDSLNNYVAELGELSLKKLPASSNIKPTQFNFIRVSCLALIPKTKDGLTLNKAYQATALPNMLPPRVRKQLQAVISIGDRRNDSHLKLNEIFLHEEGRTIPVFKIFSGDALLDDTEFNDGVRCFHAPLTDLSDSLDAVMKEI